MAYFLYEGAYSQEGWASLLAEPKDLAEALRPSIEGFGGKVVACFLAVDGHEPIGFVEFPDDISAAAWSMSISARPGVASARLRPLITTQQGAEAMRKAHAIKP